MRRNAWIAQLKRYRATGTQLFSKESEMGNMLSSRESKLADKILQLEADLAAVTAERDRLSELAAARASSGDSVAKVIADMQYSVTHIKHFNPTGGDIAVAYVEQWKNRLEALTKGTP
jgi:hypothetical protein